MGFFWAWRLADLMWLVFFCGVAHNPIWGGKIGYVEESRRRAFSISYIYIYIHKALYLSSSEHVDKLFTKCANKLARPWEWGVPLRLFSINHADSGSFWLNPKLSLDRGNHVTSNTVQFQPCLHESSLMVSRSPYGRNQKNSDLFFFFFFYTGHNISLFLLKSQIRARRIPLRLGGDELRIRARDGLYQ